MFRYDRMAFDGLSREMFVDALIAEGVPAFVAYLAIHRTPMFRQRAFGPRWGEDDPFLPNYSDVHCPVAEDVGDNVVWLHHRALLGDEQDLAELVEAVRKIRFHSKRAICAA